MDMAGKIVAWLRDYADGAGARGYVFGLSGGIDSACVAALCQRAVGDNVLALWLPCHSSAEDAEMARLAADTLGLDLLTIDLSPAFDTVVAALPAGTSEMARANVKPRLRLVAWYAMAQSRGYLVAGGGNKTEIQVGYFTKYGDAGVDLLPLGDLYKGQVRALARELGIPRAIIDRPPSAGLWPGQTDEDEMGLRYPELDAALAVLDGRSGDPFEIDPQVLARVRQMVAASAHKRALPPVCPMASPEWS